MTWIMLQLLFFPIAPMDKHKSVTAVPIHGGGALSEIVIL